MPDITIPAAAVEAAARAQFEWSGDESWDDYTDHDHDVRSKWRHETRAALRAAAPHIAAQALRDAADEWQVNGWAEGLPLAGNPVIAMAQHSTDWLRARANQIEADHG